MKNDTKASIESFLTAHLAARLNPSKTILQPVERGIDFVGQVIKPWRRTLRRKTFNTAIERMQHIDSADLFTTGNSYFGLLRQATHSHGDRATLANILLKRGHCVKADLTKTYRKHGAI